MPNFFDVVAEYSYSCSHIFWKFHSTQCFKNHYMYFFVYTSIFHGEIFSFMINMTSLQNHDLSELQTDTHALRRLNHENKQNVININWEIIITQNYVAIGSLFFSLGGQAPQKTPQISMTALYALGYRPTNENQLFLRRSSTKSHC